MVENLSVGVFKEARLGQMKTNPKLGLEKIGLVPPLSSMRTLEGSGSTLKARFQLGLNLRDNDVTFYRIF